MKALNRREAEIFAALAETYCGPEPAFPPVSSTDSVAFIDRLAAESPRLNRFGFRAILRLVELAPLARGYRARFTALEPARRTEFVRRMDRSRWLFLRIGSRLLKTLTLMSYYGDARVLYAVGYDPDANIARARALRKEQGRA
jgi:hypothetical protein